MDIEVTDYFKQRFLFMETENANIQELELFKNLKSKKWETIYMMKSNLSVEAFAFCLHVDDIGSIILDVFGGENILIHHQGSTKMIITKKKVKHKQFKEFEKRLKILATIKKN